MNNIQQHINQESRYQSILENMQDAFFQADLSGVFTFANASATRMYGYSMEEFIGMPATALYACPEDRNNMLKELQTSGKLIDHTVRGLRKDGSLFWVSMNVQLLKDSTGKVIGTEGIIRDITERKQSEIYQELYFSVLKRLSDGEASDTVISDILSYVAKSLDIQFVGIRLEHNGDFPFLVTIGFTPDFVTNEKTLCKRLPSGQPARDSDGKLVMECTCGAIVCGRIQNNLPFMTAKGSLWVNSISALTPLEVESIINQLINFRGRCVEEGFESLALIPLRSKGKTIGLLHLADHRKGRMSLNLVEFLESLGSSIAVVMQRKETQKALEKVLREYKEAGEMAHIGHWTFDPVSQIFKASPEALRIYGFPPNETLPLSDIIKLLSPKDSDRVVQALFALVESGRKFDERFEIYPLKSSKPRHLWSVADMGEDPESGLRIVTGILQDITEIRNAQIERENLQEQLHQSQKMESIGQLAGGVAHDFNNMLSVIIGYGEMVLGQLKEKDPLRNKVQEIINAAERSGNLTRQLLAFSRKQILQPRILNVNDLICNLDKMLRRLINENIQLELCLSHDINRILVDPGQIEQVIMNLVVNARDAMPEGGRLLIETSNVELDNSYEEMHLGSSAGKYVMIAVSDNGCGMSKEIIAKIFEPFFTTKEEGRGTGLGLSTVYGIVKQSGGNICVYSEPDHGTTFKIYFPQTETVEKPADNRLETKKIKGGGEHIMVVEDEKSLRGLMNGILSNLGYKVTLAANGMEAILKIKENKTIPDLIITDMVMPNMSGKQLVDELKLQFPDIKTIYMSGYTDNSILQNGVIKSSETFIQKPFTTENLASIIRKVLNNEN